MKESGVKLLVAGGAGFIGSHLVEALLSLDQDVVSIDNFATGHRHNLDDVRRIAGEEAWRRFRFIEGDIRDHTTIDALLDAGLDLPTAGTVYRLEHPSGPGIRVDSHIYQGYTVPSHYDSMVGKVIAYGDTRDQAIARMRGALMEMVVEGIQTNIPLHRELMVDAKFIEDLGADSLDTVELVMALEEEFDCEIPDDQAEKITTVKDAIAYIEARAK